MAGQAQGVLRRQHFGLEAEGGFKLLIVHLGISGSHEEQASVPVLKGQGLGDAGRLHTQRLGGQLHSGAGQGQLDDLLLFAVGPEIGFDSFY